MSGLTPVPGVRYRRAGKWWVAPGRASLPAETIIAPPDPGEPAPVRAPRKTGTKYVAAETLLQGSETIEQMQSTPGGLQTLVDRVTGGRVLTLPPGVWLLIDNFAKNVDANDPYDRVGDGLRVGHATAGGGGCLGINGSGRGNDPTVDTILEMRSSNRSPGSASGTNQLFLVTMDGGSAAGRKAFEASNFHLRGRQLGNDHDHGGLRIANASNYLVEDVLVTGIKGSNKVPPGETFSVNIFRTDHGTFRRVEVDGRRNGVRVSAAPIGINNSEDITFGTKDVPADRCYVHHSKYGGGGIAWYMTDRGWVYYMRSEYIASGTRDLNGYCFNHEQANNITYVRPTMICDRNTTGGTLHMSFNSDSARDGVDNTITVIDPVWDATAIGSGRFVIETWNLGTQQVQRNVPKVLKADGVTPLEFYYINPYERGSVAGSTPITSSSDPRWGRQITGVYA